MILYNYVKDYYPYSSFWRPRYRGLGTNITRTFSREPFTMCMNWSRWLLGGLVAYVRKASSKFIQRVWGRWWLPNATRPWGQDRKEKTLNEVASLVGVVYEWPLNDLCHLKRESWWMMYSLCWCWLWWQGWETSMKTMGPEFRLWCEHLTVKTQTKSSLY